MPYYNQKSQINQLCQLKDTVIKAKGRPIKPKRIGVAEMTS